MGAMTILGHNTGAVATMHGASWFFELAGVCLITAGTAWVGYFVGAHDSDFNKQSSKYYVEDPLVAAGLGGFVGLIVGLNFMLSFGAVADSLLLCKVIDEEMQDARAQPKKFGDRGGLLSWCAGPTPPPQPMPRAQYAHPHLQALAKSLKS